MFLLFKYYFIFKLITVLHESSQCWKIQVIMSPHIIYINYMAVLFLFYSCKIPIFTVRNICSFHFIIYLSQPDLLLDYRSIDILTPLFMVHKILLNEFSELNLLFFQKNIAIGHCVNGVNNPTKEKKLNLDAEIRKDDQKSEKPDIIIVRWINKKFVGDEKEKKTEIIKTIRWALRSRIMQYAFKTNGTYNL